LNHLKNKNNRLKKNLKGNWGIVGKALDDEHISWRQFQEKT
jgi:hypothetical protein